MKYLLFLALISFALGAKNFEQLYFLGFPDGHITDYERAITAPLTAICWLDFLCAASFLLIAFKSSNCQSHRYLKYITVLTLILSAVFSSLILPWYFGSYLMLDMGQGG